MMIRRLLAVILAYVLSAAPLSGEEGRLGEAASDPGNAVLLDIQGAIGPATTDYVSSGLAQAQERGSELVILRLDTPGGLADAMRDIVSEILASPIPVVTYVAPRGARAASAGTYMIYASHIAAMAPATNLGAATPVQMGGGGTMPGGGGDSGKPLEDPAGEGGGKESGSEGRRDEERASPKERKALEDAVSYIKGLAELRGRNARWAERAVRASVSATASEALELEVIDLVAGDVQQVLAAVDGRTVALPSGERELETAGIEVEAVDPSWRNQLLSVITNPNVAYVLMLVGLYGIIFELINPGAIVPGVLGGISILLALYAFQALPITYAGLGLIALGVAFMVAEAFAPSFGILGIGGGVAFVLGSVMLLDTEAPGFEISLGLIVGFTVASLMVFTGVASMAVQAWRQPRMGGADELYGAEAEAEEGFDGQGHVWYAGERWKAVAQRPVWSGQRVRIVSKEGLTLKVEPDE